MAFNLGDRVKDTATTTGTGTFTLANAPPTGFQSFASALASADTCWYCIAHQTLGEWEVGLGTWTTAGNLLARTTVLTSSTGSAVSFSAGTKDVFVTFPASVAKMLQSRTGTGSTFVMDTSPTITSPTFVTPALGTPASGTLTNCTGFPAGNLTGTVSSALPAYSGDATSTAGTPILTLAGVGTAGTYTSVTTDAKGRVTAGTNPLVANAGLANMATATFKGRTTAGTGAPEDLTVAQSLALLAPRGDVDAVILQDQKAQNTAGGTFTSGAWRTRTLTTEVADAGNLCSLASNQFTLSAGTYRITASAPCAQGDRHQIRLQNVTAGTTLALGSSSYASIASGIAQETSSLLVGRFTVAASQALELQHQCQTTSTTLGMGIAANFTTEIYAQVYLEKEAT